MKRNVIGLIFIVMIFLGCKTAHQRESIMRIDNLLEKIDLLDEVLSSQEVETYRLLYDTIKLYNAFFLNIPEDVILDESSLEIVYQYGTVEKTFKKLHSHHLSVYAQELSLSKHQLNNLREDISNGILTEDETDKYLAVEDSILKETEFKINSKMEYARSNYSKYQKYQPKVLTLIDDYELTN